MGKGLYNFKILPEIQSFFPAPSQEAQNRLCDSLIENGCTIPIFVWKRNDGNVIVDGHYRYKICHELGIPFDYEELEFEDIDHVKVWLLDVHISTKQLTDFQKCELAFPLEKTISEMVEKRRREAIRKARQTGLQISQSTRTADYMAQRLGLTRSKWDMAKFLILYADENLKVQLRSGKAKITPEYRKLVALIKPKEEPASVEDHEDEYIEAECDSEAEGQEGQEVNDVRDVRATGESPDSWLPRACSTDGEKAEEPPIEYIGGFKPVTHQEPMEYFPHEPERNPGPFYYVKDCTRSAMKNMIKEVKDAIYQLSDEDVDKCGEIFSMLEQAYNEARAIIEGEINFHSHNNNQHNN